MSAETNPEEPKCAVFQDELGNAVQQHLWVGTGFSLPSDGLLRADAGAVDRSQAAFTQTIQQPVARKDMLTQNGGQQMRHSLILCKKILISPSSFLNVTKR